MKCILRLVVLSLVVGLTACTGTRLQQFQNGVSNFVAGVQTVNQAIAQVSTALAQNCNTLEAAATDLWLLGTAINDKAGPALSAANATISAWCQSPPNDIASALAVTAAQINAARVAYRAAKKAGV